MSLYTPINKWKVKPEGRKILEKIEKMIDNPLYRDLKVKKINLKSNEFDSLLEGLSPAYRAHCKDEIHDVMGFTIVRIR